MSQGRINFGVIGAGGIARPKGIPAMLQSKHCRSVAVINPSHAPDIAAEFGVRRAYTLDSDLLADPDVQAVYIASPLYCHAQQIMMSAAANG